MGRHYLTGKLCVLAFSELALTVSLRHGELYLEACL